MINLVRSLVLSIFLVAISSVVDAASLKPKNGSWISVRGKVEKAMPNYFVLDKGSRSIIVEMDDWDMFKEGTYIKKGDVVVVNGRVDKDFPEKRKIEAGSVYVQGINTYFYASSSDEEIEPYLVGYHYEVRDIPTNAELTFTGTVEKIKNDQIVVNTGYRKVKVDTSSLPENLVFSDKSLNPEIGDRVTVKGEMENKFFRDFVLDAEWMSIVRSN